MAQSDKITGLPSKPYQPGMGQQNVLGIGNIGPIPPWLIDAYDVPGAAQMNPKIQMPGQTTGGGKTAIAKPVGIGSASLGEQQIFKAPNNQAAGWGSSAKPTWNIMGGGANAAPFGMVTSRGSGTQPGAKPNFNIFGGNQAAQQQQGMTGSAQTMTAQGAGVTNKLGMPSQFLAGPDTEMFFDPVEKTWRDSKTGGTILPFTIDDILNKNGDNRFKNWAMSQEGAQVLDPLGTMQDQFPMMTDEELAKIAADWIANHEPEVMPETPPPPEVPQPTQEPVIYPGFSGGKSGGDPYSNFFKALYWRVGEGG